MICNVHTDLNVADPMTKALPCFKFECHQFDIRLKEDLIIVLVQVGDFWMCAQETVIYICFMINVLCLYVITDVDYECEI